MRSWVTERTRHRETRDQEGTSRRQRKGRCGEDRRNPREICTYSVVCTIAGRERAGEWELGHKCWSLKSSSRSGHPATHSQVGSAKRK
jgi:hypothetical protein